MYFFSFLKTFCKLFHPFLQLHEQLSVYRGHIQAKKNRSTIRLYCGSWLTFPEG